MKWVMVITLLIVSSDVFSQVRGTNWGDSWEQVEKTIDESPINAYETAILEVFDLSVIEHSSRLKTHTSFQLTNGDETGVIYRFLDEKLVAIGVNFVEPILTINEYDNISGSLSKKYGEYQDEMMDWYDENYDEDNLELAIQEGALTITRVWEDNLTYIEFAIGNDDEGGIHMYIRYWSQQYYDDLMAEWDRIEMNDF